MSQTNENQKGKSGVVIAVVLFFALVVGNYFQFQLTPLAGQLMQQMDLSPNQFSSIFTSPMIASILFGIIAGVLVDKYGSKRIITIALVIAAAGLCCRPFANSYPTFLACMILGGMGITFLNVNMAKIIGGWFPPERTGPVIGLVMAGNNVGMTLGTATTAMLPSISVALWISGAASILVVVLWILLAKDGPYTRTGEGSSASLLDSLKPALKSKNVWLVGICLAFVMGCNLSLASFLPTALASRGISESLSGLLASVLTIGGFCGTFFGPSVIAKLPRMKPALITCSILAALCAAVAWRMAPALAAVLLFLAGMFISALVPTFMSFPMLLPEIGPVYAGSAGGIITTLELLGAVIIPTYVITPLAGDNFQLYFILAAVSIAVMTIFAIFLPELNKKKAGN
ncbi:MAG: CynX/NimT family MFS transporter [Blautia sp.]|jgi:cyanate permease